MPATLTAQDSDLALRSLLTSGSPKYQLQAFLGQGAFGSVIKCKTLDDKRTVALKVIQLQAGNKEMANNELATLKKLRSMDLSKCNIVQWNSYFIDRGHMCLEFECLDRSLVDYMKERKFRPLLLKEIRPIVQQIAHALKHLKAAGIVHADLKLDNVMLVDQLRQPYRVKLIDFGLACQVSAAVLGSYVQTRPYRSPEILLGHAFTDAVDMWSLGCMAAALYLGALLYPGLGEYEMIMFIMDTQGQLPVTMLNRGRKTRKYFRRQVNSTTSVWKLKTPDEYRRDTGKRPMENRSMKFDSLDHLVDVRPIKTHNSADRAAEMSDVYMFVDMLKGMLQLDPNTRATPCEVMEHTFISMRHIAGMRQKSSYVWSCFQRMEICQKEIQTSDSRPAVCGPLVQPQCVATNPVQPNPPSHAESRKTHQPHHTSPLPCTSTQFNGTDGSRKRKIDHDDVPYLRQPQCVATNPVQPNSPSHAKSRKTHHTGLLPCTSTQFNGTDGSRKRKIYHDDVPSLKKTCLPISNTNRSFQGKCDFSSRRHDYQLDQRTRPGDHNNHQHNTGPSGSTRTEGQAHSGLKRKRDDHDDVPSHDDRRSQENCDYSRRRHYERKRGRNDGSTCRGDHWHTLQRQPDQRTGPAEHHHPSPGPSDSSGTESPALSGLNGKSGTDDDVRMTMQAFPCQIATPAI